METVLVLGARGFLGGHICRTLLANGYRVKGHSQSGGVFANLEDALPHPQFEMVQCRLGDPEQIEALLSDCDYVIHAAIPYPIKSLGWRWRWIRERRELLNVLNACKASPIRRSVFVSVMGTIGKTAGTLGVESLAYRSQPGHSALQSKYRSERLILERAAEQDVVVVNPTWCVGDYDAKPSSGMFVRFLLRCPFWVFPNHPINMVDVRDVARGIMQALRHGRRGERYLLGGDNLYMRDYIQVLKRAAGRPIPRWTLPGWLVLAAAWWTELLSGITGSKEPLVPLIGVNFVRCSQHYSLAKAERELGYRFSSSLKALVRGYRWLNRHGHLPAEAPVPGGIENQIRHTP